MKRREIYISIDIEADGPCPGLNSMLSLGAVVVDPTGVTGDTFYRVLHQLPNAVQNPDTLTWWEKHPAMREEAFGRGQTSPVRPHHAMLDFDEWVGDMLAKYNASNPVIAAAPAGFDFTFLYYYLHRFTGRSIVGFAAFDMKTAIKFANKVGYTKSLPPGAQWKGHWKNPTPHHALTDAISQAHDLHAMMQTQGIWTP